VTDGAAAIPEVQALLRTLATDRDVAELGAAFGETASLLSETARSVVAVEHDPERAAAARSASSSSTVAARTTGRRSSLSSSRAASSSRTT
jgi:predicted O-methyltransferase YrrM